MRISRDGRVKPYLECSFCEQGAIELRLTVYSDYSLRLLMYLAIRPERLSTVQEVARAYNISNNHLMKVVHALGRAGYVQTIRGRSGGIKLGRAAEAIGLGELIRHTEPDMDIVPCFEPENESCPLRRACRLKGALDRARLAFLSVLDEYTLADLTSAPGPMRSFLGLSAERQAMSEVELAITVVQAEAVARSSR
jgi:Rrf2 family nitric oxide-sensitive transcriptional repressor